MQHSYRCEGGCASPIPVQKECISRHMVLHHAELVRQVISRVRRDQLSAHIAQLALSVSTPPSPHRRCAPKEHTASGHKLDARLALLARLPQPLARLHVTIAPLEVIARRDLSVRKDILYC